MYISGDWAGETVTWLRRRAVRTRSLLDKLGIDGRDLKFGRQVSIQHFAAILDYGALKANDRDFGLHRGNDFHIKNGGVLAYLAASAESVKEAVSYYQRYASVVCDGFLVEVEHDNEGIELSLHVSDPAWRTSQHLGEFAAARTISALRTITGTRLSPVFVRFMCPKTRPSVECKSLFSCRVDYGARVDAIKFSSDAIRLRIPTADSRLGHMLRAYADGLLQQKRSKEEASLSDKVMNIVTRRLATGDVAVRDVAVQLNLSERTLRRRLREAQVSFAELVRHVRLGLAEKWLAGSKFDLKHISFLLGYSEPSAFSRAYKRWTGRSPSRRRAK